MTLFRLFLIGFLAVLVAYTAMVIGNHGLNLVPVFFGDMASLAWPGQFNLDFFGYLLLSAIWVAWRHHFTSAGLGLAALASVGGMLFLSIYLLIVSAQARGDIRAILLGARRARP